jgi:hypothetical protein
MGILPGWWLGAAEGRSAEPYLTSEKWDGVLKQAGFSGTDAAIYDAPSPYHINANIISRPATGSQLESVALDQEVEAASQATQHPRVTFLYHSKDEDCERVMQLCSLLQERGFQITMKNIEKFQQIRADDQELMISLLDIRKPFLESISAANLTAFQAIVSSLGSTPMLWIMPPAQKNVSAVHNPSFGLSLGLLRTLRNERSIAITTLEMDHMDEPDFSVALKLVDKMIYEQRNGSQSPGKTAGIDPNRKFLLTNGALEVGGYQPISLSRELALKAPKSGAVTLQIGRAGLLQTLKWVGLSTKEPAHDEVVVEPRCVGLNFRLGHSLSLCSPTSTPESNKCVFFFGILLTLYRMYSFAWELWKPTTSVLAWKARVW